MNNAKTEKEYIKFVIHPKVKVKVGVLRSVQQPGDSSKCSDLQRQEQSSKS